MAKRKNASQHNQNRKDHRNGIKRVRFNWKSTKGRNAKILRNTEYAQKYQGIGKAAYETKYGTTDN